jgi:hypothetical protein
MLAAIRRRVERGCRIIPVMLPGAGRGDRSALPELLAGTVLVELRHGLDDSDAFHRLLCGIRGTTPGPAGQLASGGCPYRGLAPFREQDSAFFFGRGALTGWLLDALRESGFSPLPVLRAAARPPWQGRD